VSSAKAQLQRLDRLKARYGVTAVKQWAFVLGLDAEGNEEQIPPDVLAKIRPEDMVYIRRIGNRIHRV
jgi:hypothetical protein